MNDNFRLFNEHFAETKYPLIAANRTWSGRVMMNNGFEGASEVVVKNQKNNKGIAEVIATFPRKK